MAAVARGACALALSARRRPAAKTLKVGITLHPYYSFVANIVGDRAEIVPLIDADANPHSYAPQPDDMIRVTSMDVLVVNGIGHDEWAFEILEAAGMRDKLTLIYANDGVSLIPVAGDPSGQERSSTRTRSSRRRPRFSRIYTIAQELGELDPENATYFRDNGRKYALRHPQADAPSSRRADRRREPWRVSVARRCTAATTTSCKSSGLQVTAVIEPRHGVEPTARQLAETIDRIKAANVNVLFAEKYFASKLSDTIREATGVQMYSISHHVSGQYTPEVHRRDAREPRDARQGDQRRPSKTGA